MQSLFYEPRIKVEQIDVTPAESFDLIEGRFTINIEYSVPGTNSRFNIMYMTII
ncbi:GPW/gp25 family protein [Sphingobacterium daejeonense]|uniref:GPW/gp25 family protein n=1 Tax=Sphingobacterium daejeonense TaxID=371142 RepID=UPI0010C3E38B|nr:GPW/gp25 family protein [Sphingobacterium daejeonense]VTP99703.1 Uncharacterised protein [Sphingobacterium daejeonense]